MRFHTPVDSWAHRFLAALALSPLVACSSYVEGGTAGSGGAGGSGSGGASGTGLVTSATSTGTTGAGGARSFNCDGAKPVEVGGQATGYEECEGGWLHRPAVVTCPSLVPRQSWVCPNSFDCTTDAECPGPNGYCADSSGFDGPGCYCASGCTADADCGSGQVCLCGDPVGRCVQAACTSDAQCGGGLCSSYVAMPGCGGTAFACQAADDQCAVDADCPDGKQCSYDGKRHYCASPDCAIGRPFLVEGVARVASITSSPTWKLANLRPCLDGLDAAQRETLAAHWTRTGLMEHASIAAFARFVLELMSVGAPPELVRDAQTAMADETRHTEMSFALASAYAGRDIGPGPLDMKGSLDDLAKASILERAILEGCIGETVSAIEAAEMAARTTDLAVKGVLEQIADDETRHAELAWRFVQWAVSQDEALNAVATAAFASAFDSTAGVRDDGPEHTLASLGVPSEGMRRSIRRDALARAVAPCARALLAAA